MIILATLLTLLVVLLHIGFFTMETIAWEHPKVRVIFRTDPEFAARSKVLAGNQGVYNLVLAAMVAGGLALHGRETGLLLAALAGVVIVGLYGALTVSRRILFIQAAPAALALILWLL